MEKYLKDKLYYSDLYDRHTVEQCRRTERLFGEKDDDASTERKRVSKKEAERINSAVNKWYLHIETGERYINKAKTIREWMDADRVRDELLESAQAPEGIRCLTCRNLVKVTFKQLWSELEKPDRVLFMYDCPNKCVPRRAFFSDGEEWLIKQDLCPRCDVALTHMAEVDGEKLVTTYSCTTCIYIKTDEYVWTPKKEESFDENFASDRDRFCLTSEEGRKYEDEKYGLEQLAKLSEEWKEKEKLLAEKLKANPKGFILEGVGRTCAICGGSSREEGSWYDKYGLKCLVCQKAIDEGEIPASLAKNKESWYSKYNLDRAFNLKTSTLKKWVKEGIIKSRTVSYYGKGIHTELFLLEDNKDFLPPKKLVESHSVSEVKNGTTWHQMHPWYHFVDPFKHLKKYKIIEHMRIVPSEEIKAREEEEKKLWEDKQARRELKRKRKK